MYLYWAMSKEHLLVEAFAKVALPGPGEGGEDLGGHN